MNKMVHTYVIFGLGLLIAVLGYVVERVIMNGVEIRKINVRVERLSRIVERVMLDHENRP